MKKLLFIAALCLPPFMAFADNTDPAQASEASTEAPKDQPRKKSKFDRFTSTSGKIICFTDYKTDLPKLDNINGWAMCRIRIYTDINTGKKTGFLRLTDNPYHEPVLWENIEYSDLGNIIEAITRLKTNFINETFPDAEHTCFFRTEDLFDIGYYSKEERKDKARWFLTIYGKRYYFKKNYDFENALRGIYGYMTELLK